MLLLLQISTLVGMWLIPVVLSLRFYWWRFITVWSVFSLITGFVSFKATRKPIAGTTPRCDVSIPYMCLFYIHCLRETCARVKKSEVMFLDFEKKMFKVYNIIFSTENLGKSSGNLQNSWKFSV